MIIGIWGEDKTCKSTLLLSILKVIDTKLLFIEFDTGGYNRAISTPPDVEAKLAIRDAVAKGRIIHRPLVAPLHGVDPGTISFKHMGRLKGYRELWGNFLQSYVQEGIQNPEVGAIGLDTGTVMWKIMADALLEEKQDEQEEYAKSKGGSVDQFRERLGEIEYGVINGPMTNILHAAKNADKHLIVTHHARDEYKKQLVSKGGGMAVESVATGNRERAGFRALGSNADMIVRTYITKDPATKKLIPYAEICNETVPIELVGTKLKEPTMQQLFGLVQMAGGSVK